MRKGTVIMQLKKNKFIAGEDRRKAEALLEKMTFQEKLGQLVLVCGYGEAHPDQIRKGLIGGFLMLYGVDKTNEIQKIALEESRLGIPMIFGFDVIHGFRTMFPIPLATAASWDMKRIRQAESIAAREAYAAGINWIYAPMVDLCREPRWGRIAECAGEDPFLGCCVAQARVEGFQTVNPETGYFYTGACFKHYAGYGLSEGGRDYETTDISERTLHGEYMKPYQAAVNAGAVSAMSSFNCLNGEPVSGSRRYLTDILRGDYGFEGFVVSDWDSVMELIHHRVAADRKDAARIGMRAGCDMDMNSRVYIENLEELVNEDPSLLDAINESVVRILTVKYKLGLFDNPYRAADGEKIFVNPEFRAVARDVSAHSMVLLKNENQALPLRKEKKYLVTGPLADAVGENLGMWSFTGEEKDVVNFLSAFQKEKVRYEYIKGCHFDGDDQSEFEKAKRLAGECDGILYVCGEPHGWSGEARSRVDIDLPPIQNQYLELLASAGKPIVSVVMTGRPLACTKLDALSDAVLLAWHAGIEAGPAVCDCLFGRHNPCGKLPATFPRATGQIPIFYSKLSSGRPDTNVHNRYVDCPPTPLYPFGHGLSYAEFVYSDLRIENAVPASNGVLHVSVQVKNNSAVDGYEVVQVYFKDIVSTYATPDRKLCDFEKVFVPANSSVSVSFDIPCERFALMTPELKEIVEPGDFLLYVGGSSQAETVAEFRVEK